MPSETSKLVAMRKQTFTYLYNKSGDLPEIAVETPEEAVGCITALFRGYWKYVDTCLEKELPAVKQTCRKGCSYCCSQPILMDAFEAVACIHGMNAEAVSSPFEKQFPAWLENFTPQQPVLWKALQEDRWDELDKLTKKLTAQCPFLHNNECTCYEIRPMVCRTWMSNRFRFLCKINPSSVKYAVKCQDQIHDAYNIILLHIANSFEIALASGGWTTLPLAYNSCEGDALELLKHAIAKHITYSR